MLFRLLILFVAFSALAQNGDKAGETQAPLVPADKIPPAPVLSPADALKTFHLPEGFHIQLVASEPLVHDPIAMQFDGDGRMWVVEMVGFMRNPDGKFEDEPVASISILEDTDHDGVMDKRTVFLDHLVMPRAVALVAGGVLVSEPPHLWFYKRNGDKPGERIAVSDSYAAEATATLGLRANPEHAANGLFRALDNWIYSANCTSRYRYFQGRWITEPTLFRGQWGISQDDSGRLVYNSNSDQFRIDLFPSAYFARNPHMPTPSGLNLDPIKDQNVWPIRVNPGVNRGYQAGMLRENGKLAKFTAACAPIIYQGNNFPAEFYGNAFVCEPSANLIKRDILQERDGKMTGKEAYSDSEFLASTDERFRPVDIYNGPEGGLYIVDMYHGIIQHRVFLTTYLRKQSESRGLETPTGLGRIYRVVYGTPKLATPHLQEATPAQLVAALSNPNGWWRSMAQNLLVDRNDPKVIPALEKLALNGTNALGRLHALWTLEGLNQLNTNVVFKALHDSEPKVRVAALRISEKFLPSGMAKAVMAAIQPLMSDASPDVQVQLAFTLGEISTPAAWKDMVDLATAHSNNPYVREALISSVNEKETAFAEALMADDAFKSSLTKDESALIGLLARTTLASQNKGDLEKLIADASNGLFSTAIVDGFAGAVPKGRNARVPKPVLFDKQPTGWEALEKPEFKDRLASIDPLFAWPGKKGYSPEKKAAPLTADEQKRFEAGKELFLVTCAACHQPTGLGQEGLAPPLVNSDWVSGPQNRLIRIALQGARGPISVNGKTYALEMAALGPALNDEQLADVLTYLRHSFDFSASAVTPETIQKIRAETTAHDQAWTEPELLKIEN